MCYFITSTLSMQNSEAERKKWPFLTLGDHIDVIVPGYEANDDIVKQAKENLLKHGFIAKIPDNLIDPQPLGYSNTEDYRAKHLKDILTNEDSKIIWALKGGRGTSSLLPYLDDIDLNSPCKLVVGYSDVTALHLWANQVMNWPSLHGVVLGYNREANHAVNKNAPLHEIINILTGRVTEVSYKLTPLNKTAQVQDTYHGSLVGGNISVIQRSIGTGTYLNAKGKILFLEDVGEEASKIYEIYVHLKRAEVFKGVMALFLGNFTSESSDKEKTNYEFLRKIIGDDMDNSNIPVVVSEDFGHGNLNHPLPFNTPAILSCTGDEVTLTVQTNN